MMWPLSQDYNEAIQSPASNFSDPDLRRGEAACNALGLPMPHSGNFADVYQVRCPDGRSWAVKCFTREAPHLRERYQKISQHLRRVRLPFMVDFTYLEQGISVVGKWYPVLKMQWVEGMTLNQFVGEYADSPEMLGTLLLQWGRVAKYLRAAQVGHCDLQHGNILLAAGAGGRSLALKLIDYDGMWVPALAGKKSGEVGHPSYQHPQRLRDQTYSLDVDRFPVLLIATALRALQVKGKALWDKYDNGDNLLFREADLLAPLKSQLFFDLTRIDDPLVGRMMDVMVKALRGKLEKAPLLEEVMPETTAESSASHQAIRPAAPTPRAVATPLKRADAQPGRKVGRMPVWPWVMGALIGSAAAMVFLFGVAAFLLAMNGNGPSPTPAGSTMPPNDKDSPSSNSSVPTAGVEDLASIEQELGAARVTYANQMDKAKAALLHKYEAVLEASEVARSPQVPQLEQDIRAFQSDNVVFGREELPEGVSEYWRSLRAARSC